MNGEQIGIKLADGSFYPVLEEEKLGRKKMVLTTARDNQESVQIDLFRGEGELTEETQYVGSLMIENINPAPKREPEIEVVLGVDDQGNLEATASDVLTGESQSLSVSLESLSEGGMGAPEFELEREEGAAAKETVSDEFEESLLTGETYPLAASDRRKEHLHKRRRNPFLVIAFVVLCLILIAAIAFLVFRFIDGQPIPALFGGQKEEAGPVAEAVAAPAAAEGQEAAAEAASAETETTTTGPAGGLWYDIKWGDTLWDISATYYRNPWLYPKIARENSIANPDLIIAGTKLFIPEN